MDVTITAPGCEPVHTTTEALEQATRHLERQNRSRRRLREGMSDSAELASDMAAAGLISEEAAAETGRLAKAVAEKLGGKTMGDEFEPTHPPREGASERMTGDPAPVSTVFAKDQLRAFVERIVRLEDEKKTFADDIKEVYGEAKGDGFDPKALRRVVRLQRMDQSQKAAHAEVESILETYMQALGMI